MLKTVTNIINASQIQTPITLPGDVTLSTGNLVIGTSGKGIDFSADPSTAGMTSELLDDYEEGTWTPIIVGSSSAGTATYNIQIGRYTKIGRLVTVQYTVVWAGGNGSGDLRVSGLPFTANATSNNYASGCGQLSNVALTASNYANFAIVPNVTYVSIGQSPVGGGAGGNVAYDAAGTIIAMATYEAA